MRTRASETFFCFLAGSGIAPWLNALSRETKGCCQTKTEIFGLPNPHSVLFLTGFFGLSAYIPVLSQRGAQDKPPISRTGGGRCPEVGDYRKRCEGTGRPWRATVPTTVRLFIRWQYFMKSKKKKKGGNICKRQMAAHLHQRSVLPDSLRANHFTRTRHEFRLWLHHPSDQKGAMVSFQRSTSSFRV